MIEKLSAVAVAHELLFLSRLLYRFVLRLSFIKDVFKCLVLLALAGARQLNKIKRADGIRDFETLLADQKIDLRILLNSETLYLDVENNFWPIRK